MPMADGERGEQRPTATKGGLGQERRAHALSGRAAGGCGQGRQCGRRGACAGGCCSRRQQHRAPARASSARAGRRVGAVRRGQGRGEHELTESSGAAEARGNALVDTDISVAVPQGTYARIAPRSRLAWKYSIDVGAGVVDADYRGTVGVILFNHSGVDFAVKPRDCVAQLVVDRIATPGVAEVNDLDATLRGEGDFVSTGV
ncbi:deoxyuridine 5'-triphosphate nucleotidohydrolase-like [Triticum dicoccoides]|uniref:deoxyuridine 5'-triphosphate nucleotidohydrolase-like n=1 Tax=Triticum dicoccoides TaxID=85692 RepID=UPI00188FED9C|nr:deoxyuridine 5'-triphosphate nucleotidohydrolase-like [Triticum dicoccoides]